VSVVVREKGSGCRLTLSEWSGKLAGGTNDTHAPSPVNLLRQETHQVLGQFEAQNC
jgi:hypothetical protein